MILITLRNLIRYDISELKDIPNRIHIHLIDHPLNLDTNNEIYNHVINDHQSIRNL